MQFVCRNWRLLLVGVTVLLFTTTTCPQVTATTRDATAAVNTPDPAERLLPMLTDADADVRKGAALALAKLDDGRAIQPLFTALHNATEPFARNEIENAIFHIWDLAAADPLLEALQSDDPVMRKEAAHFLARFPESRVSERLATVMANDPADNVREEATVALGTMCDLRAVTPLIAMLQHRTAGTRGLAAQLLGKIGDPRAVDQLLELAQHDPDNSEIPQERAIEALGAIDDARAIKPLLALLPNVVIRVRYKIIETLNHNSQVFVLDVLSALTDKNPIVRRQAAYMLGKIGDQRAIDPLIAALQDEDLSVRNAVIQALGGFSDTRVIEPLAAILRKKAMTRDLEAENARESEAQYRQVGGLRVMYQESKIDAITLRVSAAISLGQTDNPLAVTPLITTYNDKYDLEEHWVPEAVLEGLQRMHNLQAGTVLLPLLASVDPKRRVNLIRILGSIGGPQITGYLLDQLRNANSTIRLNAVSILINNSDARVPAALLSVLNDHDSNIRKMAAYGLGHMKVADAIDPLVKMLTTDTDQNARASAASALGELKAIKAAPLLIKVLGETKNTNQFAQACFALANIGDTQAIPALLIATKNPEPSLRWQALSAISRFKDPRVTRALMDALHDPVAHIRPTVVRALGLCKETEITETLIGLLSDKDAEVRSAAAEALGMRKDMKAADPLLSLLKSDVHSRRTVAQALGQLKDSRAVRPLVTIYYNSTGGVTDTIIPALGAIGNDRAIAELTRIIRLRWGNVEAAKKTLEVAQAGKK